MKKNTFKKLSTIAICTVMVLAMAIPTFAKVTAVCGETPAWEGEIPSEDYPEVEPSIEVSPEYGVIYNPDTGETAEFPADSAFYYSGEDDDYVDLGEEMDNAATSIGLPTREEIAEGQIAIWPLLDLQIEEAIQANPGADPREIANDIIYNAVGDEYCLQ